MKNTFLTFIMTLFVTVQVYGQEDNKASQELFDELKTLDSLVFKVGYNNCDTTQLRKLLSDDFEFYHDQNGLVESKEMMLQGIPNLCKMNYRATRVLVDSSLQVYPLYAKGELYGAIQTGTHEFYGEEEGKPKYLTSTAIFTHVWILEAGDWKLRRILSYNHVVPKG